MFACVVSDWIALVSKAAMYSFTPKLNANGWAAKPTNSSHSRMDMKNPINHVTTSSPSH